ncbi:MAG: transcription antitermination factor NusB, partial [Bacteroidales bacterium]|nr:transcription antitermination factor NusB [Bacteroidales bacterium]
KSIYWIDDWELVCISVMKFVKSLSPDQEADFQIPVLFNDSEDKTFAIDLFRKTILNMDKFDSMISKAAQNWDIDRIALMDILIMKMALTELEFFPNVPVRVTLNEFIEISKNYSTPRSNIFINGVLDKLVDSLKNENRLQKTGKGLME